MLVSWIVLSCLIRRVNFVESADHAFVEGEHAYLRCKFDLRKITSFEVQFGNRLPFLENGILYEERLSVSQVERFNVTLMKRHHPIYEVQIMIKNISRQDAGLYSCNAYDKGEYQSKMSKSFNVHVEYPPGKASCTFTGLENYEDIHSEINRYWKLLNCTAHCGSRRTHIVCYQNRILTPYRTLSLNGTMIFAEMWIKSDLQVHCCSETSVNRKNVCDCNDFMWSPKNKLEGKETCPDLVEKETIDPTEVSNVLEKETSAVKYEKPSDKVECFKTSNLVAFLIPFVFVIMSMSVTIYFLVRKMQSMQHEHESIMAKCTPTLLYSQSDLPDQTVRRRTTQSHGGTV